MHILITGATGFIGSHLVERLAGEHEITALARRLPAAPRAHTHYVMQELAEPLDLERLPKLVDVVIHQAAMINTAAAPTDAAPFLINVVATWRLLHYAQRAGARLFVHASTGGVYGCRDRPFVEEDPFQPMNLYSLTKSQAELAVRYSDLPFPKVMLRYFFPYGAGTPNAIPSYVRRALHGEPIQISASRKPAINPIHISDAVEATVRAMTLDHDEVLNIAGNEVTTFAAIAELAAQQVGRRPDFEIVPDEAMIPYYRANIVASIEHMRQTLQFSPTVRLETGIAEMVSAFTNPLNPV
jgi:nucleoside-diphosphate-sugar epimerase